MIARLLLALFLLILTSAAQAQEVEPVWLEVADVALRLREGPSTDDDIITQLTPREAVVLLERGEGWSQVRRQDGLTGWAHNDYLLPWDERNRPDTWRRVGDRRLFRLYGGQNRYADLRVVSDHSYIYSIARFADNIVPTEQDLQELGKVFDQRIYQQSLDLWGVDDPPDIGGDERIVILFASGFYPDGNPAGWYSGRDALPHETDLSGMGYLGLAPLPGRDSNARFHVPYFVLAHEFGHLLHHHVGGGNNSRWVQESLATFTAHFLMNEHDLAGDERGWVSGASSPPSTQLNREGYDYPGYLFMIYLYERLGAGMLRDFAAHSQRGLAALDDLLADRAEGMDADTFFADWVLGNYLLDTRREGGRYGYRMLDRSDIALPAPSNRIRQLPVGIRDSAAPYSANYHELPLPQGRATTDRLLLDFRLGAPAPQDAWLQLVQVLPERIDVQRFRASEHRNHPVPVSLEKRPQRVFVAISPFTASARQRTRPVSYSLAIRQLPAQEEPRAQVTATLNLRSNPEIADNVLAKLQPCSLVQVLQRAGDWSQVLTADGLSGWSHNDFLFHLDAPSAGASPNSCALLTRAAHDGDLAAVQGLLAAGANVNADDAFGRSALHEAAFWGHERILDHLLRAGADVEARDAAGRTPLDEVILSGDAESILLLIEAGTGLDLSDPAFRPLMIDAAATGNNDLLDKILASNHDVNWRDADGRTALAAAAESGQFATLKHLIALGADVQLTDKAGRTPLMLAAARGQAGMLRELLKAGADVNRHDHAGDSALTLAAANGQATGVAGLLLVTEVRYPALQVTPVDIHHSRPDSGRNALHLAAAAGHADVVAMLLLGDADSDAQDAQGLTARQLAMAAGHDQVVTYLNMAETENPPGAPSPRQNIDLGPDMLASSLRGDLAKVERLLGDGAPVQVFDSEGLTPLMLAARGGHRDVALRLLLAGAHPDTRENTGWDEPALFYTIRDGHDDITAMLLLADALPAAARTIPRMSALMWAADFGREDIVHLLLTLRGSRRLNVNGREYSGWTPLFPAVANEHANIVRTLLAAGADPNLRPFFPNSPSVMDFARSRGNREIIDMLLAAGAEV
ncbi:MAG: ankyrin repeat domain-containing protein [Anaerolineaceae bacterium]|nr:ankyrin repeat domain-containing protein [Anaerolineaceae bacterium]